MQKEITIGTIVQVGPLNLPGKVASIDLERYNVDVSYRDGTVKRNSFMLDELTVLDESEDEADAAAKATTENLEQAQEQQKADDSDANAPLHGSSVQPATWTLADGSVVQLGTVVAKAHADSGLSVADFNALPDDEHEALIAAAVDELVTPFLPQKAEGDEAAA